MKYYKNINTIPPRVLHGASITWTFYFKSMIIQWSEECPINTFWTTFLEQMQCHCNTVGVSMMCSKMIMCIDIFASGQQNIFKLQRNLDRLKDACSVLKFRYHFISQNFNAWYELCSGPIEYLPCCGKENESEYGVIIKWSETCQGSHSLYLTQHLVWESDIYTLTPGDYCTRQWTPHLHWSR